MKVRDIYKALDTLAPTADACDWDNVGLLVGSMDSEVERVYIALDATEEVIAHAINERADLIITHHPMIFSPMKSVTDDSLNGRRVIDMISHDISYIAMHTNFDIHKMCQLSDEMLGLNDTRPLELCTEDKGIGSIGSLDNPVTLGKYAAFVRDVFDLTHVKVFGDEEKLIKRVATVPGSGKSDIGLAIEEGADVLVTGDIDHHSGIDAVQDGLAIIDAGHYGIEHIFIMYMAEYLDGLFPELMIFTEPKQEPFYIV